MKPKEESERQSEQGRASTPDAASSTVSKPEADAASAAAVDAEHTPEAEDVIETSHGIPWRNKKSARVGAAVLAGIVMLGGGVRTLAESPEDIEDSAPKEDEAEPAIIEDSQGGPETSMDKDPDTPGSSGEVGETSAEEAETPPPTLQNPEIINKDHEPVLLTADEPRKLAYQIFQNFSAAENANHPPSELSAIHAVFGDTTGSKPLISHMQEHVSEVQDYTRLMRERVEEEGMDPYYIKYGLGEVTAQTPDDDTLILSAPTRVDYSPINHPDNETAKLMEFELEKSDPEAEGIDYLASSEKEIWVIREYNKVSDYEIRDE